MRLSLFRRSVLLALLAILLVATVTHANAQGSISATITPPVVALKYDVEFWENFTALSQSSVIMDATNSSGLLNTFNAAIQRLVPGARFDSQTFNFQARIVQSSSGSNMWRISENVTGDVLGANPGSSGVANYNIGFLSMNLSDPLVFGGVEYNRVGQAYILQPLDSQRTGTKFYLDQGLVRGGPYSNAVIPGEATSKFSLLDFSWIPKVSSWTHTYRPFDSSSMWTLKPGTDSTGLPFNVTAGIPSPEGTLLTSLTAFINPTLMVSSPPRSWSQASTIFYNNVVTFPTLMAIILAAVVILAAGSYVSEKRITRSVGQTRRKRR